jgi:uncharacterized protein (DUF2126 family)
MQVTVTGLANDRYVLTCNGQAVPLRPTGNVGEFVGGVRYRAWQQAVLLLYQSHRQSQRSPSEIFHLFREI